MHLNSNSTSPVKLNLNSFPIHDGAALRLSALPITAGCFCCCRCRIITSSFENFPSQISSPQTGFRHSNSLEEAEHKCMIRWLQLLADEVELALNLTASLRAGVYQLGKERASRHSSADATGCCCVKLYASIEARQFLSSSSFFSLFLFCFFSTGVPTRRAAATPGAKSLVFFCRVAFAGNFIGRPASLKTAS